MLQTVFSASYLAPEDLALLARVLDKIHTPGDTPIDREDRAANVIQLFQSGVYDEEGLIEAMTRRERT